MIVKIDQNNNNRGTRAELLNIAQGLMTTPQGQNPEVSERYYWCLQFVGIVQRPASLLKSDFPGGNCRRPQE